MQDLGSPHQNFKEKVQIFFWTLKKHKFILWTQPHMEMKCTRYIHCVIVLHSHAWSRCAIALPSYHMLWRVKASYKVKILFWLLLKDHLLTQQRLQRKGILMQAKCWWSDPRIGKPLWQNIRSNFNMPPLSMGKTVEEMWLLLREFTAETKWDFWDIIYLSTCWNIWKERNRRVFSGEYNHMQVIFQHTVTEIHQYSSFCVRWRISLYQARTRSREVRQWGSRQC
jgi:zinc-binding in reverse transcriptase